MIAYIHFAPSSLPPVDDEAGHKSPKQRLTWHRPKAYPVVSRYISTILQLQTMADMFFFLVCVVRYCVNYILKGWRHDHCLTNFGAIVKKVHNNEV